MISISWIKFRWHYIIIFASVVHILFHYKTQDHLNDKDVESALKRVKSDSCRRELTEFATHKLSGWILPQLWRSCRLDKIKQRIQKVGCFLNTTEGMVRIEHPVLNISLCLDLCFSYSHSYGGYNSTSSDCFCGEETTFRNNLREEECLKPEEFEWYKVDNGINRFGVNLDLNTKRTSNTDTRIAFLLILNGRSEIQIHRLLKNIYSNKHIYYIHVDSREHYLFNRLLILEEKYSNIIVTTSRFSTVWGGPALLRMIIDALKHLSKLDWDYIINLSESDFPIKQLKDLEIYLGIEPKPIYLKPHSIKGYNFIKKQGLDRDFYQCEDRVWRMGRRLLPRGIVYTGGSDWFALPRDFCLNVISNINVRESLVASLLSIYNYTLLPVESFFHTVALNGEFCDRVTNSNLRLTNWNRKQGCNCQHKDIVDWCGCSPLVYRWNDWEKLYQTVAVSDLFFSRKFDPTISSSIISAVEEHLISNAHSLNKTSYDTRFWLNVLDDEVPEKKTILKSDLRQFGFLSLNSLEIKFTNFTLESVDYYYESDRFAGLLSRYCFEEGCMQLLVESKTGVHLDNYNHGCFNASGFSLNVIEVNHGFDTGERIFRDYKPLHRFSNIVVYHEWQVDGSSRLDKNLTRRLKFTWKNPYESVEMEQMVTLKSSSKPLKISLAHRLNIPKPIIPGLWSLTISYNNIKCLDYSFLVFGQQNSIPRRISAALFSRFYNVSKSCSESVDKMKRLSCGNHDWDLTAKRTKLYLLT